MILTYALIKLQSYHSGTAEIMQSTEYVNTLHNFFFKFSTKFPLLITLLIYFVIYHQSLIK